MGYIYYFKNKLNGKYYIGQTIRDPKYRYYQHTRGQVDDGTVFHNAIKKYGIDNFEFKIIGEFKDEELNEKEQFYIKEYNSHWRDGYGYNMSYGGQNSPDILERQIKAFPLDKNMEPIREQAIIFKSISECSRHLTEISGTQLQIPTIIAVCKGRKYSHKNYTFCYIDEDGDEIPTGYQGLKGAKAASKENIKKCHEAISNPFVITFPNGEEYYFASRKLAEREIHVDSKTIKKYIDSGQTITGGTLKGAIVRSATEEDITNKDNFDEWPYPSKEESCIFVTELHKILKNKGISIKDESGQLRAANNVIEDFENFVINSINNSKQINLL